MRPVSIEMPLADTREGSTASMLFVFEKNTTLFFTAFKTKADTINV